MMLKRDRFVIIALRQAAEVASQEGPAELGGTNKVPERLTYFSFFVLIGLLMAIFPSLCIYLL